MTHPLPEKHVQRAILDYLKAESIWHMRCNAGNQLIEGPRRRMIRMAPPGTADILAILRYGHPPTNLHHVARPVWIECKSTTGKQSPDQREFQRHMESIGAIYILARCVEDVMAVIPPRLKR